MITVLQNFSSSLDRVRDLAQHILSNTTAALVDSRLRSLQETQRCGAVVLLSGYFEAFLKDCVRKYVEDLSSSGVTFSSLPKVLQDTHFESGGKILTEASRAASSGRATTFGIASREDIVARLHSTSASGGAGSTFQILWEAFADTSANPRPKVVKEMVQRLGISNVWPEIALKASDVESRLIAVLDDLIAKRNECAHTGLVSPIPTPAELLQYVDTLQRIATGLVALLNDELAKYPSPPVSIQPATAGP